MNYLHLQEDGKPLKCFKTWRACATYIYDNNIKQYFIAEEGTGNVAKTLSHLFRNIIPRYQFSRCYEYISPTEGGTLSEFCP